MAKISKRVAVLAVVISIIALIVLVNIYVFVPDVFRLPEDLGRIKVSNLKIEPSANWHGSNISLTVTNTYTSPVTVVGSNVNGVNFGYIKLEIPPGQTQDTNLPLNNLAITNSTAYDAKLTFTFENGQYETYSKVITPQKYTATAVMDKIAYSMTNETFVSITFHNTGNIPLTAAKIILGNYETTLPLTHALKPTESAVFENQTINGIFQNGINYPAKYEFTFAEGSVFYATNTVIFIENTK